jgi:hypothetical protein
MAYGRMFRISVNEMEGLKKNCDEGQKLFWNVVPRQVFWSSERDGSVFHDAMWWLFLCTTMISSFHHSVSQTSVVQAQGNDKINFIDSIICPDCVSKEGKVVPVLNYLSTVPWGHMREWRYSSTILKLDIRWRWVVSFTPWPIYPLEIIPGTYCIGGWMGLRAGLEIETWPFSP